VDGEICLQKREQIMRMAAIGLVAAVIGGTAIYDNYDKKNNYQPVNARITAVNEQCYLEKSERGLLTKTTSTSDLTRCEVAEILARNHPKWQGYDIKHKIDVSFGYVSPVDGAWHTGNHQLSAFPDGRPLRAGDGLPILISKTKADKTRGA
jgi:hypothetical protein